MLGTNLQKVARLAHTLSSNPGDISRYLKNCTARPIDIGKPWFSWPAIDFLESYLTKEMSLFEYGSGGSTLFFSARVGSTKAVEDNRGWYELLAPKLAALGDSSIDYTFASAEGDDYAKSAYVVSLDRPFDVIVVDGTEDWPDQILRDVCFARAQQFVRPGGIIVVDDAWRYDEIIKDTDAKSVSRFLGVGPGRFGVTRTDVYFY